MLGTSERLNAAFPATNGQSIATYGRLQSGISPRMQVNEQGLAVGSGFGAVLLAGIVLGCWRLFYPVSDAAILLLVVLGLMTWRGTYLRVLTRRSVWRKAIWRPGSAIGWLLTGRFGAHLAGMVAACVTVPTLAHYVLGALPIELAIAAVIFLSAGLILLWLASSMTSQLRGPLALPLAAPVTLWLVGLSGTAVLLWVSYTMTPAPAYLDADTMADTIAAAQASLPARDHLVAQALAGFRSFEAGAWRIAQTEMKFAGTQFGLIFLLVYNALVAFSLARLACDAVAAAAQTLPEAS